MPSFEACIKVLEETPVTLRRIVPLASAEERAWQPAPDRWSIDMVLAHLVQVEVVGFRARFQAMASQDDPLLPYYDQLELFRTRTQFDGLAELATFENLRRETLAWLKQQPP